MVTNKQVHLDHLSLAVIRLSLLGEDLMALAKYIGVARDLVMVNAPIIEIDNSVTVHHSYLQMCIRRMEEIISLNHAMNITWDKYKANQS